MDFSGRIGGAGRRPGPEINLVPFIDILLVLLVIFIVAAPALTQAVRLQLPRADAGADRREAREVRLSILSDGTVLVDGRAAAGPELALRLKEAAQAPVQPTVRISADRRTSYESVARLMGAAARAGLGKISFVSLPERGGSDESGPASP